MRRWYPTTTEALFDHPLLRAERQHLSAEDGASRQALVLHAPDWVNVIALTEDERVLLVRQWRYGVGEPTLEIPGGVVEAESSRQAAERELLEETGYRAGRWRKLGSVTPNPAILSNRCPTYLATELNRVGEPVGDGEEELEVVVLPLPEVARLIREGEIHHALVVAAFQLFDLDRR